MRILLLKMNFLLLLLSLVVVAVVVVSVVAVGVVVIAVVVVVVVVLVTVILIVLVGVVVVKSWSGTSKYKPWAIAGAWDGKYTLGTRVGKRIVFGQGWSTYIGG